MEQYKYIHSLQMHSKIFFVLLDLNNSSHRHFFAGSNMAEGKKVKTLVFLNESTGAAKAYLEGIITEHEHML